VSVLLCMRPNSRSMPNWILSSAAAAFFFAGAFLFFGGGRTISVAGRFGAVGRLTIVVVPLAGIVALLPLSAVTSASPRASVHPTGRFHSRLLGGEGARLGAGRPSTWARNASSAVTILPQNASPGALWAAR
jgi:hypothetical protein